MRTPSKNWFQSASKAMLGALADHDLEAGLRPHMAKAIWAEIVGAQLASVTQIERIGASNVLIVRVKNSVWANELTLLKSQILERLNAALGGKIITDIRFKASGLSATKRADDRDGSASSGPSLAATAHIPLDSETQVRIAAIASEVEDPDLAAVISRSLTRAAQSDRWKREHGWLPCSRCGALTESSGDPASIVCRFCRIETGPQFNRGAMPS